MARTLAERAVYHDDFARDRFYTWTTSEQVEALCRGGDILVAEASTGGRVSPFNRAIDALASSTGSAAQVAALIRDHPTLRRRRYAWVSGFPTVLGLTDRTYGDELIAIELDRRAWIGTFEPDNDFALSFVDLDGEPVPLSEVVAKPTRIGAVYHIRDRGPGPKYREYVVTNPSMIRQWSVRTTAIAEAIDRERRLLRALGEDAFGWLPKRAVALPASASWARTPERADLVTSWHASLAFDTPRYRPHPRNLAALEAALAATHSGEPCGQGH